MLRNKNILEITEEFRKINKLKFEEKVYLFFDEITSKQDFEIQLKNLHDLHNVKIFASSSSASLLKKAKPYLTGRSISFEVLPLDFNEYLQFKNISIKNSDHHLIDGYFEDYLSSGGIPDYVLTNEPSYLSNLVDDIIYKDIAAIYNIKSPDILKEYFLLLMERAGKMLSINKLARILKISPDTSRRYLSYFSDVFLVFPVNRCGRTNEIILAQKKVYAPDLGIRNHLTGFRDKGSLFENYVFLKLKHLSPCYYYKDSIELDFAIKDDFIIEAKYHNEVLSVKQRKLIDNSSFKFKKIIRNSDQLDTLVDEANIYYGMKQ
jgi:predicted AAA+ superfamily ATPase